VAGERPGSTLPPLITMPTRLPSTGTAPNSAAAAARQPVGSTTIFMRSTKKRRVSTSCASVTVSMSSATRWMIGKVIVPSEGPCAPSAMVCGMGMRTREPERKDCWPSLPASGSTP
jgi:hypothetical protein